MGRSRSPQALGCVLGTPGCCSQGQSWATRETGQTLPGSRAGRPLGEGQLHSLRPAVQRSRKELLSFQHRRMFSVCRLGQGPPSGVLGIYRSSLSGSKGHATGQRPSSGSAPSRRPSGPSSGPLPHPDWDASCSSQKATFQELGATRHVFKA